MRLLILNAGSSSVKFSVFDGGEPCFESQIERAASIEEALAAIPAALEKAGHQHFDAIGHRIAHGGERFHDACLIDDAVIAGIQACIPLAPLHNPPALAGIDMARTHWPAPQAAMFDTGFHHRMPPRATTYAIPEAWRNAGIRRYGFHGISHRYIMERTAQALETPARDLRLISCHLGNGASLCAIERGNSIDTSMGMTPLEGLVMGTRCGDIDPGMFDYLSRTRHLTPAEIEDALYHQSGMAALSGLSHDLRDIEAQAATGNPRALLALDIYAYRIKKYLGAYAAAMNGVDAITFTGGIGEHSPAMRQRICSNMQWLGLDFDRQRNAQANLKGFAAPQLQQAHSKVKVLATQTREDWVIAREISRLLGDKAQ